jgi:hypothetical protein
VPIVLIDVSLNAEGKFFDTAEGSAPDRLLGDEIEPDLDLIEPGGVSRRMTDMPPGVPQEPAPDGLVAMGCVVVHDAVDLQSRGNPFLNVLEEAEELLVTVPPCGLGDDASVDDIQGGKQRHGPLSNVVVRDSLNVTEPHRQHGLRAVEGLDLGLWSCSANLTKCFLNPAQDALCPGPRPTFILGESGDVSDEGPKTYICHVHRNHLLVHYQQGIRL